MKQKRCCDRLGVEPRTVFTSETVCTDTAIPASVASLTGGERLEVRTRLHRASPTARQTLTAPPDHVTKDYRTEHQPLNHFRHSNEYIRVDDSAIHPMLDVMSLFPPSGGSSVGHSTMLPCEAPDGDARKGIMPGCRHRCGTPRNSNRCRDSSASAGTWNRSTGRNRRAIARAAQDD